MPTRNESGSASIAVAIAVPAFILFVGLIIFGGRTATTHQALESATADAARSASLQRSAHAASTAAEQAARASLANQDIRCVSVNIDVNTGGFRTAVGQDASVAVTLTCRLDLSDLAVPGIPGTRTLQATMSSPIDTWRERS